MKPRIKSMIWNIRKHKTTHQNSKKKKGIRKIEDSVRSFWDNFKHPNIHIIGVPEEKRKSKKMEICVLYSCSFACLFPFFLLLNFKTIISKCSTELPVKLEA